MDEKKYELDQQKKLEEAKGQGIAERLNEWYQDFDVYSYNDVNVIYSL